MNLITINSTILLLSLFIFKHWVADFLLHPYRTRPIIAKYGSWLGIEHALIHGGLTASILLVFQPIEISLVVCFIEIILQYHINYLRSKFIPIDINNHKFWFWYGTEQLVHYAFYLCIVSWTVTKAA